MFDLRPYQKDAVDACFAALKRGEMSTCISASTGSGKTVMLCEMIKTFRQFGKRVLLLTHVKELIQQSRDTIEKILPEQKNDFGTYSAGLNKKEDDKAVIFAGIQSAYKKAYHLGRFDFILIDEAHLLPTSGDGMYRSFINVCREINPNLKLIGLTATPYRLGGGLIYGEGKPFETLCYEIEIKRLIKEGWLCPVVSKKGCNFDTSKIKISGGEFNKGDMANFFEKQERVALAVEELYKLTQDRKSVLIFASSIKHAELICEFMQNMYGEKTHTVFGDTNNDLRALYLDMFKKRQIKYLVNVGVLTTGFDAPCIDCVAVLRATKSPGLMVQMMGRGLRLYDGLENCLILDYGNNIMRHGTLDNIVAPKEKVKRKNNNEAKELAKECPSCKTLLSYNSMTCFNCGHKYPPKTKEEIEAEASELDIISDGKPIVEELKVNHIVYCVHNKKFRKLGEKPPTMKVAYHCDGKDKAVYEFVCFEHKGYALKKAKSWWKLRSLYPFPETVEDAVNICANEGVRRTQDIRTKKKAGENFPEINGYRLDKEFPSVKKELLDDESFDVGKVVFADIDDIPF